MVNKRTADEADLIDEQLAKEVKLTPPTFQDLPEDALTVIASYIQPKYSLAFSMLFKMANRAHGASLIINATHNLMVAAYQNDKFKFIDNVGNFSNDAKRLELFRWNGLSTLIPDDPSDQAIYKCSMFIYHVFQNQAIDDDTVLRWLEWGKSEILIQTLCVPAYTLYRSKLVEKTKMYPLMPRIKNLLDYFQAKNSKFIYNAIMHNKLDPKLYAHTHSGGIWVTSYMFKHYDMFVAEVHNRPYSHIEHAIKTEDFYLLKKLKTLKVNVNFDQQHHFIYRQLAKASHEIIDLVFELGFYSTDQSVTHRSLKACPEYLRVVLLAGLMYESRNQAIDLTRAVETHLENGDVPIETVSMLLESKHFKPPCSCRRLNHLAIKKYFDVFCTHEKYRKTAIKYGMLKE